MDDEHCAHCGADLTEEVIQGEGDGFCSAKCSNGDLTPCVRPMYDLLRHELGDNWKLWDRAIYKRTPCGAWLKILDHQTIQVGSIVEGSEAEFMSEIVWPFTRQDFWDMVEEINDDALEAWREANDDAGPPVTT